MYTDATKIRVFLALLSVDRDTLCCTIPLSRSVLIAKVADLELICCHTD